jgi:hypothetical protein
MSSPQILEFTTLIVGSGMAGGALGLELRRRGREDLAMVSTGRIGAIGVDATQGENEGWVSKNENYQPVPGILGRIGGRATSWQGVVLPIHRSILDSSWPSPVRKLLPDAMSEVESYLSDWKGRPLDEPTCRADALLAERARAEEGGFRTVPLAARQTAGAGARPVAYNPTDQLLSQSGCEGRKAGQMTVIADYRVLWIGASAGSGIVARAERSSDGSVLEIRAEEIVLAAGTLENTRIYAQSLHRLTGEHNACWPGLVTKIKQGIITRPARWMQATFEPSDAAILVSEHPTLFGNLFLEVRPDATGEPYLDLWWLAEQRPTEAGFIEFQTGSDVWQGAIDSRVGAADLALIEQRNEYSVSLLQRWGCPVPAWDQRVQPSQAAAKATLVRGPARYVNALGLSDHESSTLAIGRHVDCLGGSLAVPGISVAGPAIFPRPGAANPSLTILTLARSTEALRAALLGAEVKDKQRQPADGQDVQQVRFARDASCNSGGPEFAAQMQ